jgi:phenylacetate-CoA ligase
VESPVRVKQWGALKSVLRSSLSASRFQRNRLPSGFKFPESIDAFVRDFPPTSKAELVQDQVRHPNIGDNLTKPESDYIRFSQTSGTTSRPLAIWDTVESWNWLLDNWILGFQTMGLSPGMRVFFAFSFGPFLGFWTAFEAAARMGLRCLPGGGLGTSARLQAILNHKVEVLCCTPTYAMHLAAAAAEQHLDLSGSAVRKIIVAGEPGGSLPEVRRLIQCAWPHAEILDHYGLTEVGPVAFAKEGDPYRLHVLEERYFLEVLQPESLEPVAPGQCGELVITPLGRTAWPLFRYRTGDLVRQCSNSADFVLEGGVLGRVDDMVIVRGVNIYPGAVEEVIRSAIGSGEYRVTLSSGAGLAQIKVEIESPQHSIPAPEGALPPKDWHSERLPPVDARVEERLTSRLEAAFERAFALRIPVTEVPFGSLPRFDFKARRWARQTAAGESARVG